ncbi:RhoGAP domain containing protein [Drechmeria coniospora]|uniref:RhoGAP domain containing protein n=1 Tax=Drechmeria coniospora TaxID=98403 RepID=A0A151GMF8_DRECN|nr:RhoGAP domain containing protein [Drechmeria coniospora]KYK58211.1 RhoGAP domain containing protein [Drechmeria coniospora]
MGRKLGKTAPEPLTLASPNTLDLVTKSEPTSAATSSQGGTPIESTRSPISQRSSPFTSIFATKQLQAGSELDRPQQHQYPSARDDQSPVSATAESSSQVSTPRQSTWHSATDSTSKKSGKGGFFHFNKSSKGSNQLLVAPPQQLQTGEQASSTGADPAGTPRNGGECRVPIPIRRETMRHPFSVSPPRRSMHHTPPRLTRETFEAVSPYAHDSVHKPATPIQSHSELSLSSAGDQEGGPMPSPGKRSKPKSFGLLGRSRSARDNKEPDNPPTIPESLVATSGKLDSTDSPAPLRTAPVTQDRGTRDMMNAGARNRSEDQGPGRDAGPSREHHRGPPHSTLREAGGGSTFFSGLRSSSTRAADMISKGLFGKGSRGGHAADREPAVDDEQYVLKVINLPLVEQTRLTRISKRLEDSRDKTEFWMPAFPWRAIDYLNYKGCDMEGLYRVPGSGPQIKKWQRKFDERTLVPLLASRGRTAWSDANPSINHVVYDVNLFEEVELYDINIIGSMLKAWLRELPDELFPKEAQNRIARECEGATEVPQMLVDELSNLSPFNYYLLFAITCHLSLLLAHSDKNKMDFRNLCICFQPCMKIDAFSFKFLVCDWRNCWKGCKNEAKFIEEEYLLFHQPPPRGLSEPQRLAQAENLDGRRAVSPDGAGAVRTNGAGDRAGQVKGEGRDFSQSNTSIRSQPSSISTNISTQNDRTAGKNGRDQNTQDLRQLSPIKPLSPIGF